MTCFRHLLDLSVSQSASLCHCTISTMSAVLGYLALLRLWEETASQLLPYTVPQSR